MVVAATADTAAETGHTRPRPTTPRRGAAGAVAAGPEAAQDRGGRELVRP